MNTFLSKSIAILLGTVFFAVGAGVASAEDLAATCRDTKGDVIPCGAGSFTPSTSTATEQAAQGQYIAKTQYQSMLTGYDPIIELRNPTFEGCNNAVANQLTFDGTVVIQQCTFVAGASGPTTATNLSVAAQVTVAQSAYDAAVAAKASGTGTQAQVDTAAANLQSAQQAASGPSTATATNPDLDGINCGIKIFGDGPENLYDCIPTVVYYLIYKPTFYLLMGAGYIFDKTLILSIDKDFVGQPFVADSWKIIRDFSNMAFIFVLLYAGISTMLGMGNWRKTVIQVVVVALLINFSLLFTKVIIDAGNILATGIYSSIDTGNSFSASLASKFKPQVFLSTAGKVTPMDATIVFIIASIVSVFAAWVFFKAALLFIGRLLAFWFLMIVSPFAFISTTFPKGNIFGKWFGQLTGQAFVAPVFLFLLYIIMQVLSAGGGILSKFEAAGVISTGNANMVWFTSLIAPILVAILIILALKESLKFAEGMAGEFGQLGAKIGGTVMGVAGGVALGGTALVGRKVIGGAAQRLEESGKLKQWATSDSKFKQFAGRNLMGANDKVRQGTFDARGLSTVQKAAGAAGLAYVGKPSAGAKGGYEGMQKRQDEKDTKFAKRLELTDDEKKAIAATHGVDAAEAAAKEHKDEVTKRTSDITKTETEIAAAEANLENSVTNTQLKAAQKMIAEQEKVIEAAKTKTAAALAAHSAARNAGPGILDPNLSKVLADAEKEERDALDKLQSTQTTLGVATQAHEASAEFKAVQGAKDKLVTAQGELSKAEGLAKDAKVIAEKAKEAAKLSVETENKRRAVSFADHVEGRIFVPTAALYSTKQAKNTAEKIRKGKTTEEKANENTIELLTKALKKTQEGGEKEGGEGKKDGAEPEASH